MKILEIRSILESVKEEVSRFTDRRLGQNKRYSMEDIGMGAFAVFFTQSPSFLDFQMNLQEKLGTNNCKTLFNMAEIPTDNHIRTVLDEVKPEEIYPVFERILKRYWERGGKEKFEYKPGETLVALDGIRYFSSEKIHCEHCSLGKNHKKELGKEELSVTYFHSAITPAIVTPKEKRVLPLPPEFIRNEDGDKKQDCELKAASRWVENQSHKYKDLNVTILGDNLFAKQPFCEKLLAANLSFVLVCKPDSHKILYQAVEAKLLSGEGAGHKKIVGEKLEYHYSYANNVPIKSGDDALKVNWCLIEEMESHTKKIRYKNAFITNKALTETNVEEIAGAGRARWKIENEHNNTLKTKGYNLEHNFGHGKNYLSSTLLTLNILAFFIHSIWEQTDDSFRKLRSKLPSRQRFFNDIRALTTYMSFVSWSNLILFMLRGLEERWSINQDSS